MKVLSSSSTNKTDESKTSVDSLETFYADSMVAETDTIEDGRNGKILNSKEFRSRGVHTNV